MSSMITDSPTGWVKQHIDAYVASGGADGHIWHGAPTLLVTTVGRRTGQQRRTALIYGRDGEDYLVVASNGGSRRHPAWYLNLSADPRVRIQVGDEVFDARARVAGPTERERLWAKLLEIWPDYEAYQARTQRVIPVVILTRS